MPTNPQPNVSLADRTAKARRLWSPATEFVGHTRIARPRSSRPGGFPNGQDKGDSYGRPKQERYLIDTPYRFDFAFSPFSRDPPLERTAARGVSVSHGAELLILGGGTDFSAHGSACAGQRRPCQAQ